jgi:hypothetical protein
MTYSDDLTLPCECLEFLSYEGWSSCRSRADRKFYLEGLPFHRELVTLWEAQE